MNAIPRELRNIIQIAVDLQRQPTDVREAASSLGIQPASRYNGLPLYSAEQQDAIEQQLTHGGQR
jgi:hypothetical protein